jgi:hypothetical protein
MDSIRVNFANPLRFLLVNVLVPDKYARCAHDERDRSAKTCANQIARFFSWAPGERPETAKLYGRAGGPRWPPGELRPGTPRAWSEPNAGALQFNMTFIV